MIEPVTRSIVLTKIPLPPSSNNSYNTFMQAGKIRHVPNKGLVAFKRAFDIWSAMNSHELIAARNAVFHWSYLDVAAFICINAYTKAGAARCLDVSNRIKALHDSLAIAIGKDDKLFFKISASKVNVVRDNDEQCIVVIRECIPDEFEAVNLDPAQALP